MPLKTEEEAFSRTPPNPVGRKWQGIELGWLPGCSVLCIKNLENPDGNTLEIGSSSVILSGQSHPIVPLPLVIPPGMITVLYPTTELAIRCLGGEARYTLFAVPE
jgi:hypothetical protein